jgi:hypothetical protein
MNLKAFLIELWRNEDGFFGVDMGPSGGETGATNALTGESGFSGSVGEGLLSNSSALINGLLSGNQSDIAKLLAPQIGAISKQANEKTQTNATFGARSGGTNASNQNTMDTARSSVNDMISSLTSGAIGQGASLGSNLLGQSMSGYNDVFNQNNTEQQQRLAQFNDLISGIGSTAAGAASGAMAGGGIAGALGGGLRGVGTSAGVSSDMFSGGSGDFSAGWDQ